MNCSYMILLMCFTILMQLSSWMVVGLTKDTPKGWPPELLVSEENKQIASYCKQNMSITEEQLHRFVNTPTMFDDDKKFKCYIKCIFASVTMPNGKFDAMQLLKQIEQLRAEDQIIMLNMGKSCMAQKEKDICDRMYNVVRCMKTYDATHFFIL